MSFTYSNILVVFIKGELWLHFIYHLSKILDTFVSAYQLLGLTQKSGINIFSED